MHKLVSITLLSALLSLGGCGSNPDKSKEKEHQVDVAQESAAKIDTTKAAKLNLELGLTYLNEGYVERAKSKLNHALKLAPELSEVHYALGYYYEKVSEYDQAEKSYRKAINLNRNGGKEHNNYGAFLCRQKRYREAEKEFLLALKDPNYVNTAELYENAGICVNAIPDIASASGYFEKSLKHDPRRPTSLLQLALLRWKQGNKDEARSLYHLYEDTGERTTQSLWLGIEIAKADGNKDKEASLKLKLNAQSQY
ncbi:MAG: type IV pilus biogenesis/stability protein PilW [Gammaproteobacteria bacterium]